VRSYLGIAGYYREENFIKQGKKEKKHYVLVGATLALTKTPQGSRPAYTDSHRAIYHAKSGETQKNLAANGGTRMYVMLDNACRQAGPPLTAESPINKHAAEKTCSECLRIENAIADIPRPSRDSTQSHEPSTRNKSVQPQAQPSRVKNINGNASSRKAHTREKQQLFEIGLWKGKSGLVLRPSRRKRIGLDGALAALENL